MYNRGIVLPDWSLYSGFVGDCFKTKGTMYVAWQDGTFQSIILILMRVCCLTKCAPNVIAYNYKAVIPDIKVLVTYQSNQTSE